MNKHNLKNNTFLKNHFYILEILFYLFFLMNDNNNSNNKNEP